MQAREQRLAALIARADPLPVSGAALFALALFRSLQQARSDPLVLVLGSDGGDGYWAVDDHVRDDAPFTRTARV